MQEKIERSVISEIEGKIIKQDADYKINCGIMESEQMYADSFKSSTHSEEVQNLHAIFRRIRTPRRAILRREASKRRRNQESLRSEKTRFLSLCYALAGGENTCQSSEMAEGRAAIFVMDQRPKQDSQIRTSDQSATVSGLAGV